MSDVNMEDQAALAIVFEENIRELVRKHLKAALEDYRFVHEIMIGNLASRLSTHMVMDGSFKTAVKAAIIEQMNKY